MTEQFSKGGHIAKFVIEKMFYPEYDPDSGLFLAA